jgi:hypothetical protein
MIWPMMDAPETEEAVTEATPEPQMEHGLNVAQRQSSDLGRWLEIMQIRAEKVAQASVKVDAAGVDWNTAKRGKAKQAAKAILHDAQAVLDDAIASRRRIPNIREIDGYKLRLNLAYMPDTPDELSAIYRQAAKALHASYGSDTAPGYAEESVKLSEARKALHEFYVD